MTEVEIAGDEELRASHLVSSGSGSADDPLVIEQQDFLSLRFGLKISSTTLHLVLRNNTFSGVRLSDPGAGLVLEGVRNVKIENSRFGPITSALFVDNSKWILIADNTFIGIPGTDSDSIVAHRSVGVTVDSNAFTDSTIGVQFGQGTILGRITNNTIQITGGRFSHGVSIYANSSGNLIDNNLISGDGAATGLLVLGSDDTVITSNTIWRFGKGAFWDDHGGRFEFESANNTFAENIVSHSSVGFEGASCDGCYLRNNSFADNLVGALLVEPHELDNNTFVSNDLGVSVESEATGRNNSFSRNEVAVRSSFYQADFRWNWWGSSTGPADDEVEGFVLIEPWLTAPP